MTTTSTFYARLWSIVPTQLQRVCNESTQAITQQRELLLFSARGGRPLLFPPSLHWKRAGVDKAGVFEAACWLCFGRDRAGLPWDHQASALFFFLLGRATVRALGPLQPNQPEVQIQMRAHYSSKNTSNYRQRGSLHYLQMFITWEQKSKKAQAWKSRNSSAQTADGQE